MVTDLPYPIAIGFGPDEALYIAVPAFGTGTGEGQGALVRVDPSVSTPISLTGVDLSTPTCGTEAAATPEVQSGAGDGTDIETATGTQLLHLSLADETLGDGTTFGITRFAFDAGGSQRTIAGSGLTILYAEEGALSITPTAGSASPAFIPAGADAGSATELSADDELVLEAGDTLLMPAGSEAEIRNDGDAKATALALLTASDAATEEASGVSSNVIGHGEEVTASPGTLTLRRVTIPAGQRLDFAAAPTQSVAAGVDPRQAMILSGRINDFATNRGDVPVDAYLVIIEPAA